MDGSREPDEERARAPVAAVWPRSRSVEEFSQRVRDEKQKGPKRNWLTRGIPVPAGASADLSVVRFWDVDTHDDGSATVHIRTEQLSEHSKTDEEARFDHRTPHGRIAPCSQIRL